MLVLVLRCNAIMHTVLHNSGKLRDKYLLASPGYTPGTIAVNVTWMEKGFNACVLLVKESQHIPIYLQPFPSNSNRKFKSSPFLSRVSILLLTRDIDIVILSVRPSVRLSVCLSVRDALVLYENGLTYRHSFSTIR